MSLKLRYPLRGDTSQQGIVTLTVILLGGGPAASPGGPFGPCMAFTPTKGIRGDGEFGLSASPGCTVSLWVNPVAIGGYIFSLEIGTYWQFTWSGSIIIVRDNAVGNTGARTNLAMTAPPLSTWTHCALVYDAGTIRVYYNGQLSLTLGPTGGTALNNGITQCVIGTTVLLHSGFNGSIADFRVYNKALTENEIYDLSKGLIAHYLLGSLPNSTYTEPAVEYDVSGHNYMLNIIGTNPTSLVETGDIRYDKQDHFTTASLYLKNTAIDAPIRTICFWGKLPTSLGTAYLCFMGNRIGNIAFGIGSGMFVTTGWDGSKGLYTPSDYKLGGWNWFCIYYDAINNSTKMYCNNVEQIRSTTTSNNFTYATNDFLINARNNGAYTSGMNQAMSDLRVYATELTEEDRNRLYAMGRY